MAPPLQVQLLLIMLTPMEIFIKSSRCRWKMHIHIWRVAAAGKQCRLRIRHVLHVRCCVGSACQVVLPKKLNEAQRG